MTQARQSGNSRDGSPANSTAAVVETAVEMDAQVWAWELQRTERPYTCGLIALNC